LENEADGLIGLVAKLVTYKRLNIYRRIRKDKLSADSTLFANQCLKIHSGTKPATVIQAMKIIVFRNFFSLNRRSSSARFPFDAFRAVMFLDCFFKAMQIEAYAIDDNNNNATTKPPYTNSS
jgi:hypothetical protein